MPSIEYMVVRGPKDSPGYLALDGLSDENAPFTDDDFFEVGNRTGAARFSSRGEAVSFARRAGWKGFRLRKVTVLPALGLDAEALRRLSLRCDEQISDHSDDSEECDFWGYVGSQLIERRDAIWATLSEKDSDG